MHGVAELISAADTHLLLSLSRFYFFIFRWLESQLVPCESPESRFD